LHLSSLSHPSHRDRPAIRLVALDIDGTLLDSGGRVPAANVAALARAIEAGVEVVLATGRRFDYARPVFEALPQPLTLILSNGAIVKTPDGATLARHLLPRAVARDVLRRTLPHAGTTALVFDRPREGQLVFETIEWDHPRHRRFFEVNRPFLAERAPLEEALTEDPLQVMFTGRCVEMRAVFEDLRGLQAADGTPHCAVSLTEYQRHDFSLVDVIRAGCSKGAALRAWAEARGCTAAEVMAVGDNLNDLEMLEFAGRPVVMGNGVTELKERGWALTGSNDEHGVARAVETFVLGPASYPPGGPTA
jgi:Cof subfamily protein (haloacid dehalogenase superfamily)